MTPRTSAAFFLAAALAAAAIPAAERPAPDDLASADGEYRSWLEPSAPPGVDFFRFANGGWLKDHPIPADRAYWGVDTILEQESQTFVLGLVESLANGDWPAGSEQRKVADFYSSGMDEAAIESAGTSPLGPEFARIAAIGDSSALLAEFARLQTIGIDAPLQIGQMQDFIDSTQVIAVATQSGLGLPNRDYYLKSEPTFSKARSAYLEHVQRMFALLGDAPALAVNESRTVLALETRLASASMPDAEQRNPSAVYHPVTLVRAEAMTPHLHWRTLLAALGHAEVMRLNVGMPKFFEAIDRELAHTSLTDWKTYLRWQLIDGYAPYLSKPYVDEDFRMSAALTGAQELQARWLRVLRAEDGALGFAIGKLYVAEKFPPRAKAATAAMVGHIRDALHKDLATLAWMTPATRAAAQQKLDLMELRLGYPERWRDYSGLNIERGAYAENIMRANEFEVRRQLAKIGKPVDRSEWYMTPQTVNAYYDPSMNSLNVPAGILQHPYFDVNWSDAVNYGSTGATIGHEMTHGFDDEGAKFDGHGNLRDWWAPQDLEKFQRATRCISSQYSAFTVGSGLHIQGDLVTGEATADLGGLMLAWRALQDVRGHDAVAHGEFSEDQAFFLAYAHSWAGAIRPQQAEEQITTDPHPLAQYRTNATLANSPEFQRAFGLPDSSPMVKKDRCIIW